MSGPYETEQEARGGAIPQAVADLWRRSYVSPTGEHAADVVLGSVLHACARAGVTLGAYDVQVLSCLARCTEPETAQVIAGLIERAYEAGRASTIAR